MNSNAVKRKEKRWAIMVKPTAVISTGGSTIPLVPQTTWSLSYAIDAVETGETKIGIFSNIVSKVIIGAMYKFYTAVTSEPAEILKITGAVYNSASSRTVITVATPFTRNYAMGSRIVGGGVITTLTDSCSEGDTLIRVSDSFGMEVGMPFALDNGATTAEVVYISGIDGTDITISSMLYYSHASAESVSQVNQTSYEASSSSRYSVNFDTVYGKSPSGGNYIRLNSGLESPWVQVDEVTSFQEAKDIAETQASIHGLGQVRIFRVVDLYDVLYPIS